MAALRWVDPAAHRRAHEDVNARTASIAERAHQATVGKPAGRVRGTTLRIDDIDHAMGRDLVEGRRRSPSRRSWANPLPRPDNCSAALVTRTRTRAESERRHPSGPAR